MVPALCRAASNCLRRWPLSAAERQVPTWVAKTGSWGPAQSPLPYGRVMISR
jgi:hypothetical protein